MRIPVMAIACGALTAPLACAVELSNVKSYREMCDASAIADAGDGHFFVACDEDNKLRLYARDEAGAPISEFDLDDFLGVTARQQEADLEASARIGDRVYWIGSYGNSKDGERRPNRLRFFATRIDGTGRDAKIVPVGKPCKEQLFAAIASDQRLADGRWRQLGALAPEQPGAVNIEGLAATPEGTLWIAFRNPVPQGQALLVELSNPAEVIEAQAPKLGRIARLNLDGAGIRGLEYWPEEKAFLIASGPYNDDGEFHLWRWSGQPDAAPVNLRVGPLEHCTPEAMTLFADSPGQVFILSDDGSREVDGEPCKDAKKSKRSFRGGWLKLPAK